MVDDGLLASFGFSPAVAERFAALEPAAEHIPARVVSAHRTHLVVVSAEDFFEVVVGGSWHAGDATERPVVGDWVLLDAQARTVTALLPRSTLIARVAAGTHNEIQPIAANVDVLFVVTSANQEFNPSRIERYLALAYANGVRPVVVLTKTDCVDEPSKYMEAIAEIDPSVPVAGVNALDTESVEPLRRWCAQGETVALVGSSGVGKSTLINTLTRTAKQVTGHIRDDDGKGRHTTTARSLHPMPGGAVLLDSPGMREIQISDIASGLGALFADIEALITECRFANCTHATEPGCAVRIALAEGRLKPRRLESYTKLHAESEFHDQALARKRSKSRRFDKMPPPGKRK